MTTIILKKVDADYKIGCRSISRSRSVFCVDVVSVARVGVVVMAAVVTVVAVGVLDTFAVVTAGFALNMRSSATVLLATARQQR